MNKHETDVFSLAFGAAFLVIAASWAVAKMIKLTWLSVGWVVASALVLIGLWGLVSAILPRSRSRSR